MKRLLLFYTLFTANLLLADGLPNAPYVYAVGYASKTVAADLACLSFSLEQRNLDSAKASAAVEAKTQHLFAVLENLGIARNDITAAEVTTRLRYDDDTGKEFLGYEISRSFELRVNDISRYGVLLKALLDAPVDSLVLRSVSSSKEDTLGRELEEEARIAARKNADVSANSYGAEVIGVYAISPRSFLQLSYSFLEAATKTYGPAANSQIAGSSITVVLPPVTIQREAHAIFLIRNKTK